MPITAPLPSYTVVLKDDEDTTHRVTVTGESACASPENYNAEIGRKIARENAKQKIWALEGYVLKNKLAGI